MTFIVYILECSDGTYYIGYTNNLKKRIIAHNELKHGAKYTRFRRPVILKYFEEFSTLSDALKREYFLKQLSREQKKQLITKKEVSK